MIVGIPFLAAWFPNRAYLSGKIDAISSASVIIDKPSGDYVVYINKELRKKEENNTIWKEFFESKDIPIIFEDIKCQIILGDKGAYELAQSFQSRLPQNQMSIEVMDGTFLVSKADSGRYDILIMSKEFYEAYRAESIAENTNSEIVFIISEDTEAINDKKD